MRRSGPFFTIFLPHGTTMGWRVRQKLASLGRILAFDAQSPTGSWEIKDEKDQGVQSVQTLIQRGDKRPRATMRAHWMEGCSDSEQFLT